MKIVARNKKASFNYHILNTYEAGIVLKGTEIKSIRASKCNIADSYCLIRDNQLYITNMHIAKYEQGNIFNHDETRRRTLLMHKKEIIKINNKMVLEDLTLIPLKVYIDKGLCKLEIALAKGKKNYDKRQSLKEKDAKRNIEKSLKERI
jgi:SsrA-binding protein